MIIYKNKQTDKTTNKQNKAKEISVISIQSISSIILFAAKRYRLVMSLGLDSGVTFKMFSRFLYIRISSARSLSNCRTASDNI